MHLDQVPNLKEIGSKNEYLKNFVTNINKNSFSLDKKNNLLQINKGTSITKVIEILMLHSTYIQDQLTDFTKQSKTNTSAPLNWFKITPRIKLGKWDEKIGRFAYHITYIISTFVVHNVNFQKAPQGTPGADGFHKEYNYMFTGQNNELLNFDIKYNTAYYRQTSIQKGDDAVEDGVNAGINSGTIHNAAGAENVSVGVDTTNTGGKALTARDLARKVLQEGPEMVNLNAEIIGDPAYIMQSDIFYQDHLMPSNKETLKPFLSDGSINYDYGNLLINIKFKFPTDYGDNGIMDLAANTKYRQSDEFSGVYSVTHVTHNFSGGSFVQNLRGVRLLPPDQNVSKTINRVTHNTSEVKKASNVAVTSTGEQYFDADDAGTQFRSQDQTTTRLLSDQGSF